MTSSFFPSSSLPRDRDLSAVLQAICYLNILEKIVQDVQKCQIHGDHWNYSSSNPTAITACSSASVMLETRY